MCYAARSKNEQNIKKSCYRHSCLFGQYRPFVNRPIYKSANAKLRPSSFILLLMSILDTSDRMTNNNDNE